jgi:hypothetical protein
MNYINFLSSQIPRDLDHEWKIVNIRSEKGAPCIVEACQDIEHLIGFNKNRHSADFQPIMKDLEACLGSSSPRIDENLIGSDQTARELIGYDR